MTISKIWKDKILDYYSTNNGKASELKQKYSFESSELLFTWLLVKVLYL